jgi:hypothetical protein
MKRLSETTRALGYIFGIHDQYRDYYYDAPSFDFNNAVENIDGSHHYETTWYGGPQTLLCATLAEQYVRRNYAEFKRLGIEIEAAYLDVFSVVNMDECFNPEHPMTREQCAAARNACFELLNDVGLIEPHGGEGIPVLRTEGFDHLAFAPIVDGGDAGHLARHEYHIVVIGGFQRRTFGEVKIGARIEPHEVFHLVQPEFVEILFPFFSDGTEGR